MSQKPLDLLMLDRHPAVQLFAGLTQHGKTTLMNWIIDNWPGVSIAVDAVCPDPPLPKHIAAHASSWVEAPPEQWPASVSLVACDEVTIHLTAARSFNPAMREAVFRGQHTGLYGVSALLGTQRAASLDISARSQAQRWYIFRTVEQADLEIFRRLPWMTETAMQMIPKLPPGYAVVHDLRDGLYLPRVAEWAQR